LTDNVEAIITGEEGFEKGGKPGKRNKMTDGWVQVSGCQETQESDSHGTKP
jgi:hypothetical protein